MKAGLHRTHGSADVIEVVDVPDPEVGPGDVLIAVRAATLNRLDILQREGPALLPGFSLPHIAGTDVAGEVIAIGDEVSTVKVGARVVVNPALHCGECELCRSGDDGYCPKTRVVGGNHPGGFAELCAVPATHVFEIPDGFDYVEAATVPTIYSTAWHALFVSGDLRLGETVLIHAAASGVSTAGIQLAKRAGATVIATAGSEKKLDLARKIGADVAINNRADDWVQQVRDATDGRGVDMVFDHVGPALFQQSLFALRPRGRMVFCGVTTGPQATFNLPHAYHFGMRLIGADPYSYKEFAEMLAHYWTGGYEPVVDSEFSLDDLAAAQRKLESGDVMGKVVIRP
ncbi:MAG TPA: zinc-binding dehydrogenase [Acidimicrobiales bacterium]